MSLEMGAAQAMVVLVKVHLLKSLKLVRHGTNLLCLVGGNSFDARCVPAENGRPCKSGTTAACMAEMCLPANVHVRCHFFCCKTYGSSMERFNRAWKMKGIKMNSAQKTPSIVRCTFWYPAL